MRKKGKSGRSIGKLGRNEELRNLEEGLPRLIEENWKRAARSYQATSGVGCDGFHSKAPPDLSKETMRTCFLRSLSSVGEMAASSLHEMFFLIPKNFTSERPTALLPTLIRSVGVVACA